MKVEGSHWSCQDLLLRNLIRSCLDPPKDFTRINDGRSWPDSSRASKDNLEFFCLIILDKNLEKLHLGSEKDPWNKFLQGSWIESYTNLENILRKVLVRFWSKLLNFSWSDPDCLRSWPILSSFHQEWAGLRLGSFLLTGLPHHSIKISIQVFLCLLPGFCFFEMGAIQTVRTPEHIPI